MTLSVLVQSLIVGAAVLVAAVYMLGRYAPKLVSVPRAWLAQQLQARGHSRLAARVQPAVASGGGCHSGGGDGGGACGSCGSCGSSEAKPRVDDNNERPLVFHRKR